MFRVLFFILICTLLFYSFWNIYSPIKDISDEKLSTNFEQYLSGALARNIPKVRLYDVVFYREDFVDISAQITDISPDSTQAISSGINKIGNEKIASLVGNFGTPDIYTQIHTSDDCRGLIFDPCLVIGDPTPASGGMDFGSDKS